MSRYIIRYSTFILVLALVMPTVSVFASSKISTRSSASLPLAGTETIGIIQNGVDRKITVDALVPSAGTMSVLSTSAIPFIKASSGTMGNNGAISAMTALPRTYSSGAWLWLPAGSVAAGVPATDSWLWFVGSSATAGTVYNSTYTSGQPTIGTTTAFVTTGPGAYTGSTATINGPTITMPANTLGNNGRAEISGAWAYNNTAGTKTGTVLFGGSTTFSTAGQSTSASNPMQGFIQNRGLTNVQTYGYIRVNASGSAAGEGSPTMLAVNTASSVAIIFTLNTAAATDHHILEAYHILLMPF